MSDKPTDLITELLALSMKLKIFGYLLIQNAAILAEKSLEEKEDTDDQS